MDVRKNTTNNGHESIYAYVTYQRLLRGHNLSGGAPLSNRGVNRYVIIRKSTLHFSRQEIKRRLNSGNACYHSVHNLLFSRLLSKNVKIRIYRIIILPVVLYGCETSSLILREKQKLRVLEQGAENIWTEER
jgi:hypothetical protein